VFLILLKINLIVSDNAHCIIVGDTSIKKEGLDNFIGLTSCFNNLDEKLFSDLLILVDTMLTIKGDSRSKERGCYKHICGAFFPIIFCESVTIRI
jgi:hypothetical protein